MAPRQSGIVPDSAGGRPILSNAHQALLRQLRNIDTEIQSIKADIKKVSDQIKWYQTKVEQTPRREQELLSLNRDYGNVQELYNSILNRKLESEMAVSMERKQKGEQFKVVDSAKIPETPVKPDVRKIILLTLILGLGLGGGMAYLVEILDTSYKTPEDLEKELSIPVWVSMPISYTEREVKSINRKKILVAASVSVGFILSAVGIVFAVKGVATTFKFIIDIFAKL